MFIKNKICYDFFARKIAYTDISTATIVSRRGFRKNDTFLFFDVVAAFQYEHVLVVHNIRTSLSNKQLSAYNGKKNRLCQEEKDRFGKVFLPAFLDQRKRRVHHRM